MKAEKVTAFRQQGLRLEESFAHKTDFRGLVNKYGADNLKLGVYAVQYEAFYVRFNSLTEIIRKSYRTDELEAADIFRDEMVSAVFMLIDVLEKHYNVAHRPHAHKLQIVCKQFSGMARANYPAETASIRNFIQALESYKPEVQALGMTEWISQLGNANETFDNIYQQRNEAYSQQLHNDSKEVRAELDGLTTKIIRLVSAYAEMEDKEQFNNFLREADVLNKKFKTILSQRKN